jgi:hypothetical protein
VTRPTRALLRPPAPRRRRWLLRLAGCAVALAVLAPASVAAAADTPTSLTIVGVGMTAPITIRSDAQQALFSSVLRQVSWMSGRSGDFAKPDLTGLGPKYTLTIFNRGVAAGIYELYPEAAGGPRAHRPARQPKGNTAEAWFYATVTLPSVLRTAGVPLAAPTATGQAGAYEEPQYQPDAITATSGFSFGKELGEARLALAATAAIALVVLLLLFGAAQLSRRFTR